jgi:protein gp37
MTVQFNHRTMARGIEWTDETRNPIGGCTHGCAWQMPDDSRAECYAKWLAEDGIAKTAYPRGFESHYFRHAVLKALHRGREPLLIFVDSMSDLFAADLPRERTAAVLGAMRRGPQHAYQSLTKAAPQILKHLDDLPSNLWVGSSSPPDWMHGKSLSRESQRAMLRRSMDVLHEVKATVGNTVWMSAEPLSWDLTSVLGADHPLDWIVIGAASNGRRYFQPEAVHVRELLDLMDQTRTPVFFKGNLGPLMAPKPFHSERLDRWREDFPARYRDGSAIPAIDRRHERCRLYGWPLSEHAQTTGEATEDVNRGLEGRNGG